MGKFLEHRIADRRVLRLINKWLRAGVSEDGEWSPTEVGTPQAAVVSQLLANIYLHYVFDLWVNKWRKGHATGEVIVIRYADDIVMGFEQRQDEEQWWAAWRVRLKKFGLELHPEKTRLVEFGRFAAERRKKRGDKKPETKVGAVCGNTARTDLCGGRRATGVPTTTANISCPRPILSLWILRSRHNRKQRILPQMIMATEVLVSQRDTINPLGNEVLNTVLPAPRITMMLEATRKPLQHSRAPLSFTKQQHPSIRTDLATIKPGHDLATGASLPGLGEVIDSVLSVSQALFARSQYEFEVQRAVQRAVVDALIDLAANAPMPQVRAIANLKLKQLQPQLTANSQLGPLSQNGERALAHASALSDDIRRFLERPATAIAPRMPAAAAPPGAPIGSGDSALRCDDWFVSWDWMRM